MRLAELAERCDLEVETEYGDDYATVEVRAIDDTGVIVCYTRTESAMAEWLEARLFG